DCKSVVNDFGGSNPPPPTRVRAPWGALFIFCGGGFESRHLAACWMHAATGVAFSQKSESTTSHQSKSIARCSFLFYPERTGVCAAIACQNRMQECPGVAFYAKIIPDYCFFVGIFVTMEKRSWKP
ncbi:MAG: hypothetical protein ACI3XW_06065, partial [Butyricicoccus sp.]